MPTLERWSQLLGLRPGLSRAFGLRREAGELAFAGLQHSITRRICRVMPLESHPSDPGQGTPGCRPGHSTGARCTPKMEDC
jgi:hypothetical protein